MMQAIHLMMILVVGYKFFSMIRNPAVSEQSNVRVQFETRIMASQITAKRAYCEVWGRS